HPRVASVHRIHVGRWIQHLQSIEESCFFEGFVPPQEPLTCRAADRLRNGEVEVNDDRLHWFAQRCAWIFLLQTPATHPAKLCVLIERCSLVAVAAAANADAWVAVAWYVAGRGFEEGMM